MFNVGDRFKVIENGNLGTVLEVEDVHDQYLYRKYYRVKFDGHNHETTFNAIDVEFYWEKVDAYSNLGNISSQYKVTFGVPLIESKTKVLECLHTFVEYRGFVDNYKYCTKCDVKDK